MKYTTIRLTLCVITLLGLAGCATLPANPDKPASFSQAPVAESMLVEHRRAVLANSDPLDSAFMLISNNEQAMRWRLALIDSAQQSQTAAESDHGRCRTGSPCASLAG
jgi:starvation-inducible outer membrane lipoprotein